MIGLDASGRIELPNRAADDLLGLDLLSSLGRELADVVPEFADLLHEAAASPERARTAEIQIGPPPRNERCWCESAPICPAGAPMVLW